MRHRVLGAVLAGGASSRFGSDKAMAVWRGRTLLEHAHATLAAVVDEVTVVGRDGIADLPHAGLGPLGAIAGALDHGARYGFDSVMTIACDMPVVPDALLGELLARAPAYCADAPVLAHWPTALTAELIARLATVSPSPRPAGLDGSATSRHPPNGALSVRRWAIEIGATAIASPTPIPNINTAADLATL